ncbi:MAG: M1 family metallopeptidase [Bacteroidetes bacterium]|nr:M1 family metallopeptidase [Bacteroidota bacterium]
MTPKDIHSFARPEEAVVEHLSLNLNVDFNAKIISGTATLSIKNKTGANQIHLDSKGLNISSVVLDSGEPTSYSMADAVEYLGSDLTVAIKPETKKIVITYSTSPDAGALQWLDPAQTNGGTQPFLFTQSQAILARTWIPLQDSPGIKFTYDATIKVPSNLMALMSAENDTTLHPDGIYRFNMPQAIPSYLMALAVGDLQFRSLGPNCGVFAEPAMIEKSAWEFADLHEMITSAESLYGPYAWGRYDVLVLPPSFPFGGMENPRITFATPTIIAGDRSLVALIAHELAHSWSGNLVTNATWNDFWLNEGFTVYFETRIMEKIYGKDYADMLTLLSLGELRETIKSMGDTSKDTHLYLDLAGRDPDDGVSDIAYEKGRFFLTSIEYAIGRERWDAFLNSYFKKHAWGAIDTKTFLAYLESELIKGDDKLRKQINAEGWIYAPGLPANCPEIKSTELEKAGNAATAYKSGTSAKSIDTKGWTTHHWMYFLRNLNDSLDLKKMEELDAAFGFTNSGNSEIQSEWYQHAIASGYEKAFPNMEKFLMTVGRRKFLKPIYSELAKTQKGLEMGRQIYQKARPGYHAVSIQTIDGILGLKK